MDWRREGEMLEQILALLVSFASLADRAAGLPLCLALPVLAFLARGEAVARSFLIDLPSGALAHVAVSNAADRAERLAAEFRAQARLLRALLARARRRARFSVRDARPPMPPHMATRPGHRVPALAAPDTS
jgi:hypothetical protein